MLQLLNLLALINIFNQNPKHHNKHTNQFKYSWLFYIMGNVLKYCGEGSASFNQCGGFDLGQYNPCMIRETSNKELIAVLTEFDFKGEAEDKWYGKWIFKYIKQLNRLKVNKELDTCDVFNDTRVYKFTFQFFFSDCFL